MKISRKEFEKMIQAALAEIPKPLRRRMENIAVTLESEPSPSTRRRMDLRSGDFLLGLYEGIPNTRRGADYGNVLPDKITIYWQSLMDLYPDPQRLREEVRKVVWHEVGHYFGLSDTELRKLE